MVLRLLSPKELVTRAKNFKLTAGYYVYVGSAMNSLFARVDRHERKKKKHFWHIDFLLDHAELLLSILVPSQVKLEDQLASLLTGDPVGGFGASDSYLRSHLFYYRDLNSALSDVMRAVREIL